MFDAWKIGILVSASTNAPQMFASISTAARNAAINADLAAGNISRAGAASQRMAGQVSTANARMGTMLGYAAGAVALLSGAFIIDGVSSAAKFQTAMVAVQVATGAAGDAMSSLQKLALQTSTYTAQSATTIAQEMAMAARSGLNSVKQLTALFPQLAMFADVQYLMPGGIHDPVEAVKMGVQIAHYFKAYTPQTIGPVLDDLNRTMQMQPEDLSKIVRQGKYFIPLATNLGMKERDIFTLTAMMGQTGFLLGRGGTSIENFLGGMLKGPNILTAHLQAKQSAALRDLGLMDAKGNIKFMTGGKFDAMAALKEIQSKESEFGDGGAIRVGGDLLAAFGKQASQFLLTVANPVVASRMKQIQNQFKTLPSVIETFHKYMDTFSGQWRIAVTNFQTMANAIFLPILPMLTRGVHTVGVALGEIALWFANHPGAGLKTAIAFFGLTAVAATYAAKNLWNLNAAILAMGDLAKANAITTGLNNAGAGESLLSKVGRITGIAWLIQFLRDHLPQLPKFTVPSKFPTASAFPEVVAGGETAMKFLPMLAEFGSKFIPIIGWIVTLGQTVYEFFRHPYDMGEWLGKITGYLTFKVFPAIQQALSNGWDAVNKELSALWPQLLGGFVTLLQKVLWVYTHPWDAARVAAQGTGSWFSTLGHTIQDDYHKASVGFQHGMNEEAHQNLLGPRTVRDINIHIHTHTSNPKKHAKIVADALEQMSRQALHSRSSTPSSPYYSNMEVSPA
jgi:TP901 family phage tail tape measure protein